MKAEVNTRNEFGVIDLTDSGRSKFAERMRKFKALPWPGMKYFPEYGVYAINEHNAKRKGGIIVAKPKRKGNIFSNIYKRLMK